MIDAQHPQYIKFVQKWSLINDMINQENLAEYLIRLNPLDGSPENDSRNETYKERAVFYSLTNQTVNGMLGTIFNKLPEVNVPDVMNYITENIDGRGTSIYQQSQVVTKNILSISRDGLFVSFPKVDGGVSMADINSGMAVATIQQISADRIINWAETTYGAVSKLTLVIFKDIISEYDDYELDEKDTLRELCLENGVYKERVWTKNDKNSEWIADEELTPTDHSGNALSEIPFQFVGSVNNDSDVDVPNMYGMAKLNQAHYRNSADLEDSVWYAGQNQPYMAGVTQPHIDMMRENNMYVGSREILAVPENGSFGFAAATPNPLVRQAMLDKVEMMVGIGARMIKPGGVAKTAEQASNERETQHSTMTLIAYNVSQAYIKCLGWVGLFMGVQYEMKYSLNQDFMKSTASPVELRETIMGFMAGSIPLGDYVRYMKDYGIFDEEKPLEDYTDELSITQMPALDE